MAVDVQRRGMLPPVRSRVRIASFVLAFVVAPALAVAQAPITYRLSFPAPEHRWMQVDITFPDLPPGPLHLHMSRSSPGRYALHEFAKNVFEVQVSNPSGSALPVTRPNLHQWVVARQSGTVHVSYRVFGDRLDGTYLSIDRTHAHINMPAALMWAGGLEQRPVTVRFDAPAGAKWRVATQLLAGSDALTFTAPNLQYLMDSPSEFSAFGLRTFTIGEGTRALTFRLAVHHDGSDAELDGFAKDVETIVREARGVFGEYPAYEGNAYTFIADYLPWADGDGMEHRNSTILTANTSLRSGRMGLLDTISHEFFHSWNVERIRPRSLEPFNFDEVNISGELWLAEGFTSYYGPLILIRAGLTGITDFTREIGGVINAVTLSPGRRGRSAEEMSRLAPFVDAAAAIDRTYFSNTFISYYTWGEAIALGLDLTLRDRSDGRLTLDHFMRALWQKHGKPGGRAPGYVDQPYTMADLVTTLASVAGDAGLAEDFFARYIQGREVVDYARLLRRAGFLLRPRSPGRAFAGDLSVEDMAGQVRITAAVPFGSPAYEAGLERDDSITSIGDTAVRSAADFERAIRDNRPGEAVPVVFVRRGQPVRTMLRLIEDPRQEIVPAENAGQPLTDSQKRFRESWLSSRLR